MGRFLPCEPDQAYLVRTRVHLQELQEQLQAMPRRLLKLRKGEMKKVSRTDAGSVVGESGSPKRIGACGRSCGGRSSAASA